MTDSWPNPTRQGDQILSTSDGPRPIASALWQESAQPDANSVTQGCPCSLCSAVTYNIPLAHRRTSGIEHQDPRLLYGPALPSTNQHIGIDNATGTAAVINGQTQLAPVVAHAQAFDSSIAESLRRLAERYISDLQSHVDAVHLEPSTSGRLRVTIVLELPDNI